MDARTANTASALYVPEKLKRGERQMGDDGGIGLPARRAGNKKPLHRKSE
jgi:hypothetical protein